MLSRGKGSGDRVWIFGDENFTLVQTSREPWLRVLQFVLHAISVVVPTHHTYIWLQR